MGLDNGIVLLIKKDKKLDFLGTPTSIGSDNKYPSKYEVCYWRKCWGIRDAIISVLDPKGLNSNNDEYNIDLEDIPAIIRALQKFLNSKYYEKNANSIWEYDEYIDTLIIDIFVLMKVEDYLKNNSPSDYKLYFYDSY